MATKSRKTVVSGIDAGLGVKSATAVAIFNPDTREIFHTNQYELPAGSTHQYKLRVLALKLFNTLDMCSPRLDHEHFAYMETFVMPGKAGQSMQQLLGALCTGIPDFYKFDFVYNTSVKKVVAGHGRADKAEVAEGVLCYFGSNPKSRKIVEQYIKDKEWDILDALAIGIAGHIRATELTS